VHSSRSTFGDPYSPQYLQLWQQAGQQAAQAGQSQKPQQPSRQAPSQPAVVATPPEQQPSGLPSQNSVQ